MLTPLPSDQELPVRLADFSNLSEALDYAAKGETGCSFYNRRGELYAVLSYATLRQEAQSLACRLLAMDLERTSKVAIVAETGPDFLRAFFACQYAGLVPVPLPVSTSIGSHHVYAGQLARMIEECGALVVVAPEGYLEIAREAASGVEGCTVGTVQMLQGLPANEDAKLQPLQAQELAYLQYTSGSTRLPRGVMMTQQAVMNNVAGIAIHGIKRQAGDRCVSWLPFYHDMGLVGLILVPVCSQMSVDYLGTSDFAMRPKQWLNLMHNSKASISFSPPFGYELVTRRLREKEVEQFDLSNWRIAGVGAEMIHAETLLSFARVLSAAGFDERAFLPCYGMAECGLAISFVPLWQQLSLDSVDSERVATDSKALSCDVDDDSCRAREFVDCGQILPGFEMQIRNEQGELVKEREIGEIFLRGPSIMSGYYAHPELTADVLSEDGWLNTGDKGYLVGDRLFVTGRSKDVIIINGKNIWPQDIEYLMEAEKEVRSGDSVAFAIPGDHGEDVAQVLVQCRLTDPQLRKELVSRLQTKVLKEIGLECRVELVPLHTLPRTTSGKLSRAKSRENYLQQGSAEATAE